jgi:hypothetical protein
VKQSSEFMGAVLASAIRVVNKTGLRSFGGNSPEKGLADQSLCHPGSLFAEFFCVSALWNFLHG